MNKGKNSDTRYVSVGGRVPFELRRVFKAQIALDGLDVNTAIERLLQGYIDGKFGISDGEQANLLKFIDQRKTTETRRSQTSKPTDTQRLQTSSSTEIQTSQPITSQDLQTSNSTNMQTHSSTDTATSKLSDSSGSRGTARGGITKYTTDTEIGRARETLQLTQRQMAKRLGVGQSSLARYEKGEASTPDEVLEQARKLLNEA